MPCKCSDSNVVIPEMNFKPDVVLPSLDFEDIPLDYLKSLHDWYVLYNNGEWPNCCGVPVRLSIYTDDDSESLHYLLQCDHCESLLDAPELREGIPDYMLSIDSVVHRWKLGNVI